MNAEVMMKAVWDLETKLAKEEARIAADLAPIETDQGLKYPSPADGYWKARWAIQNKMHVARQMLEVIKETQGVRVI